MPHPFEEDERRLNTGSLVEVEICLALGQMVAIGSGDFVDVAAAVVVDVLCGRDSRLQRVFIPNTVQTTKSVNLFFVNGVDDFACEKLGFLLPGHFARRRNSPACSAEVFLISFLAFSMGIVRTGVSARVGTLGGVRVTIVSFSMGTALCSHTNVVGRLSLAEELSNTR